MEEAVPQLACWWPDWHDSESERSARSCQEELSENVLEDAFATVSLLEHYERNLEHFSQFVARSDTRVESTGTQRGVVEAVESRRQLIVSPSASRMKSLILNPRAYRGLRGIETVQSLAEALNVSGWRDSLHAMRQHPAWSFAQSAHKLLARAPARADEQMTTCLLSHLFIMVASALDLICAPGSSRSFGVGGLLADGGYAFRGKSDVPFTVRSSFSPQCPKHCARNGPAVMEENGNRGEVLAVTCEVKTASTFPTGRVWYHGSRGIQLLGALWSGWRANPFAPALLVSPEQYKLLIVRRPGDITCACPSVTWKVSGDTGLRAVQFPDGYACEETASETFPDVIALVLLAAVRGAEGAATKRVRDTVCVTPERRCKKTPRKPDIPTSRKKPCRRSSRIAGRSAGAPVPSQVNFDGEQIWFVDQRRLDELTQLEQRACAEQASPSG
jgi:hypothetical protein